MENKREFISGVVEGFYGRPWSCLQRKELFLRLKEIGLNTYLYAPKDDLKHRQKWRELYTKNEMIQIKILIDVSKMHNITFVYALSPGLNITFSSSSDLFLLKQKMEQVLSLGCNAFSLLFDDIDPNLNDVDKALFSSFAYAQATLSNDIFNFLNKPKFFLFCPTEYCATRAVPSVKESEYLITIGKTLHSDIDIMWTGPKVISETIPVESIIELSEILKRLPLIWDNIHANDYDHRRLYLGPYSGRSSKLIPYIRGVLLNPNCEFEANYIPMHTLAHWTKSNQSTKLYFPSNALDLALIDWMKLLYKKENTEEILSINGSTMATTEEKLQFQMDDLLENKPATFSPKESQKSIDLLMKKVDQQNVTINSSDSIHSKFIDENDNKESTYKTEKKVEVISKIINTDSIDKTLGNGTNLINILDDEDSYDFKIEGALNDINEMELTSKVEEISECSESQNQMILDNIINIFPLTPMETEDNQTDTDNVIDSMAMQIDNIYENTCEKMDVIDNMENNSNLQKKKVKDFTSVKNNKIEMDYGISNKSSKDSEDSVELELTLDDIQLLVNLFYLPYEYGSRAIEVLELINWLRSHEDFVRTEQGISCGNVKNRLSPNLNKAKEVCETKLYSFEWKEKAEQFSIHFEKIRCMVDRFNNIPNRFVLYDIYPYLQDLRSVMCSLNSYVKWMGCLPGYNASLMNDDHEPWIFRGGLVAEFQRMLPLEGSNDIFPNHIKFMDNVSNQSSSSSKNIKKYSNIKLENENDVHCQCINEIPSPENCQSIYIIQPYYPIDREHLYKLCFNILYNQYLEDPNVDKLELDVLKSDRYKDLPGDRYLGDFLDFSPNNCMVLEDNNERICGYALGTIQVKEFLKFRQEVYNVKMREKYEYLQPDLDNQPTSKNNENLSLDHNLSRPIKNSVIKNLTNGFEHSNLDKTVDMFDNSTHALIHVDIADVCQKSNIHHIDSIGFRLIKSISAALKNRITQQETSKQHLERDIYDMKMPLPDKCNTFISPHNSNSSISSLVILSEVDTSNKRHEKFYKRNGFESCNIDRNMNNVMMMSRYI